MKGLNMQPLSGLQTGEVQGEHSEHAGRAYFSGGLLNDLYGFQGGCGAIIFAGKPLDGLLLQGEEAQLALLRQFGESCGEKQYAKRTSFFKRLFDKK